MGSSRVSSSSNWILTLQNWIKLDLGFIKEILHLLIIVVLTEVFLLEIFIEMFPRNPFLIDLLNLL
jgi:hypothetical protein